MLPPRMWTGVIGVVDDVTGPGTISIRIPVKSAPLKPPQFPPLTGPERVTAAAQSVRDNVSAPGSRTCTGAAPGKYIENSVRPTGISLPSALDIIFLQPIKMADMGAVSKPSQMVIAIQSAHPLGGKASKISPWRRQLAAAHGSSGLANAGDNGDLAGRSLPNARSPRRPHRHF